VTWLKLSYDRSVASKSIEAKDALLMEVALPVMGTAFWAVICLLLFENGCFDTHPAFAEPFPGSPRAGYCDSVNSATPWLVLTLVPSVVVAVLAWVNRGHPRRIAGLTLVMAVLLTINAGLANSLSFGATSL